MAEMRLDDCLASGIWNRSPPPLGVTGSTAGMTMAGGTGGAAEVWDGNIIRVADAGDGDGDLAMAERAVPAGGGAKVHCGDEGRDDDVDDRSIDEDDGAGVSAVEACANKCRMSKIDKFGFLNIEYAIEIRFRPEHSGTISPTNLSNGDTQAETKATRCSDSGCAGNRNDRWWSWWSWWSWCVCWDFRLVGCGRR